MNHDNLPGSSVDRFSTIIVINWFNIAACNHSDHSTVFNPSDDILTSGSRCSVKGQVYQECRTCPATCSEPNKICTADCRPGCGCPPGQVIDEKKNKCVPTSSCPKKSMLT